ncbi:EAL domain-containing protein [Brevundimonas sp. NPDC092305]|uniref:EAL domain-containing protein n=1 Tax=Brevundimonas sp. NPDC092305 TaxID=3363957 RepID=UPI0037FDC987
MTSRLLGLAFASADLLVELSGDGKVQFALGAGPGQGVDPTRTWTGKSIKDLVLPADRKRLATLLGDLKPGKRSPSTEIRFLCGDTAFRRGALHAFLLPDLAPAVSCSLSWRDAVETISAGEGLKDAQGLLDATPALLTGAPVAVDFVEVGGLDEAQESHQRVIAGIENILLMASVDGASAARLAPDRFAVVRDRTDQTDIAGDIRDAGTAEGVDLSVEIGRATPEAGAAAEVTVRALRLALENCLKDGAAAAGLGFAESLAATVRGAERFRAVVRGRDFALEYQPIVDLKSGDTHHFEALTRFTGGADSPAGVIHMAEELGLIEGFDFVVVEKALQQLKRPGFSRMEIAVNVSGASLAGDAYVQHLLQLTEAIPAIRKRLMVEVTETAAMSDLEGADRRLRALRNAGVRVCLDDFGVGAASFDYLGRLSLDIVKIDGRFVTDITSSERSRTLIEHLVKLCGDLKLNTVAEMVETKAQADVLRGLGVDHGQGWFFGRPTRDPVMQTPLSEVKPAVRRRGAVEAWG